MFAAIYLSSLNHDYAGLDGAINWILRSCLQTLSVYCKDFLYKQKHSRNDKTFPIFATEIR
jgi:hypothetical protein